MRQHSAINIVTYKRQSMAQGTAELQQYQINDKLLHGYCVGKNVYVTFSEFIKQFAKDIPPATLQRKKRAVIHANQEQYCPAKYLRLLKEANAVGEGAKKVSVMTLSQAETLVELIAGRKFKRVESPAATTETPTAIDSGSAPSDLESVPAIF